MNNFKFWLRFAVVAVVLAVAAVVFAADAGPPPTVQYSTTKIVNKSASPRSVSFTAFNEEGTEVSGGNWTVSGSSLNPGASLTGVSAFPTEPDYFARMDIFVDGISASIVGASYVAGGSSGPRFLGSIYRGSGPYLFTVVDDVVLADGAKTVWALDDSTLTAGLFREGVDKLIAQGGGAGGGGSADPNWTNIGAEIVAEASAAPSTETMATAAATAAASMTTAITAVGTTSEGMPTTRTQGDAVSVSDDFWTLHLPVGAGGFLALDCNPMHHGHVPSIAAWVKMLITLIVLWMFESWCWTEFRRGIVSLTLVPQAHGNALMMGTGAQATGLLAAGILSVILVSFPAAAWAIYSGSFTALGGLAGLASSVSIAPTGSEALQQAWWMLGNFVPVGVLLVVAAQVFVVKKAGVMVFSVAAIAIKFVVP